MTLPESYTLLPLMGGYALYKDGHIICRFESMPSEEQLQNAISGPVGMNEDEAALFWQHEMESRKRRHSYASGRFK